MNGVTICTRGTGPQTACYGTVVIFRMVTFLDDAGGQRHQFELRCTRCGYRPDPMWCTDIVRDRLREIVAVIEAERLA